MCCIFILQLHKLSRDGIFTVRYRMQRTALGGHYTEYRETSLVAPVVALIIQVNDRATLDRSYYSYLINVTYNSKGTAKLRNRVPFHQEHPSPTEPNLLLLANEGTD